MSHSVGEWRYNPKGPNRPPLPLPQKVNLEGNPTNAPSIAPREGNRRPSSSKVKLGGRRVPGVWETRGHHGDTRQPMVHVVIRRRVPMRWAKEEKEDPPQRTQKRRTRAPEGAPSRTGCMPWGGPRTRW
eukprot:scaffold25_cov342-Pavlova_lutheri.AAC.47